MFVIDEGKEITAVYALLVGGLEQFVKASCYWVANWPECYD